MTDRPSQTTLGELRAGGYRPRSVKDEMRANLLAQLREGVPFLPGILGYDDTVLPQIENAVLAGQDIILPGANGLLESRPAPGDTSTWFPNLFDDLTCMGADGTPYQTPAPLLKYDQLFGLSARGWEAAYSQTQGIQRWTGHCLGGAVDDDVLRSRYSVHELLSALRRRRAVVRTAQDEHRACESA